MMTGVRQPPAPRPVSGIVTIIAVYIYFLIFAQFAFLRLVQADGIGGSEIRWVMGAMAMAGVLTSLVIARVFRETNARRLLLAGFAVCGISAMLSLAGHGLWIRTGISALIGLGLGTITVCVAASVPLMFPQAQRGTSIGIGTGLAYAFCNIPAVFAGTPVLQTIVAAGLCVVGGMAVFASRFEASAEGGHPRSISDPETLGFPALVCLFLALVWLDSAAFYILQATPEMNRFGWATASLQWSNAAIHLGTACAAGFWLDRGKLTHLLPLAFGCLVVAAILVTSQHLFAAQFTHCFYAAGVSLYSTALVFAPSAAGRGTGAAVACRAGVLYAVAGWIGSALGIGMAQDLHRIPAWFLWSSGILIAGSLFSRKSNP